MYLTEKDIEFEGNTIEDAVEKAVKKFAVSKDKLKVKVICEESRGLFGMKGAKTAKIKAHVKK